MFAKKIKGMWPLPGGAKSYVMTLRKILEKVNTETPSMDQLVSWLTHEYGLSGGTPHSYVRVVKDCLGFLEKVDDRLKITSVARQFLSTQDNKVVLDVLRERVLGFDEIFLILADGRRLELEEIHRGLLEKCNVDWEKHAQALWRLNWLASLGYVDKEHGKYYLTKVGPTKPPQPPPPTPIDDYLRRATELIEKHPKMSESSTVSAIIEPLLEILGWDVRDPGEVEKDYSVRIGEKTDYVDIALKIGNRPVVFVEAKSIDSVLHDYLAEQPVKYANAEAVSWCVLTNGREWRVYNAFWKIKGIEQKMLFKLSMADFKENIDKLLLLSKSNIVSGKLDEEGEFEHAKRIILEWLRQKENNLVKDIMGLDPSLKEEYVRRVLRKIL